MSACKACPAILGRANKSGYCRKCFARHAMPPNHGEKVSAGLKRKIAGDPVYRDWLRQRAREIGKTPEATEARRASAKRIELWKIGAKHVTAEHRAKAGLRCRETRLAWCPAELRDDYTRLIRSHRMSAAEAREMILAQHEKDMAAFRRKLAA